VSKQTVKQLSTIMTATTFIIIIASAFYLVFGFIFGMFAWSSEIKSYKDVIKALGLHISIAIIWLPGVFIYMFPLMLRSGWVSFFKNYRGTERELKFLLGRDYNRLMKKFGHLLPKNNHSEK
jgi:ABC-type antimicrobial peptide transport system permease subunit